MKKSHLIAATALALTALAAFAAWDTGEDNPGIRYRLWKMGLVSMNLDAATRAMWDDTNRRDLVLGKTKGQLRAKFGYLVPLAEASRYLQSCYSSSGWGKNKADVLFIRHDLWMIVFKNGVATDLALAEGC